jgi:hypothetical protein|tara:strand:- start:28 stop:183 length:156 start_codon:yes stop_codon:yes gene_type:complete
MFVILRNGKRFDESLTFDTVQEAIEAVRLLEYILNHPKDHSPYTISTLEAC